MDDKCLLYVVATYYVHFENCTIMVQGSMHENAPTCDHFTFNEHVKDVRYPALKSKYVGNDISFCSYLTN